MTDETDKNVETADAPREPVNSSRRALLMRGVTAAPAILTLHSGAALARSSNLISEAPAGTRDANGNLLCLDTTTVDTLEPGLYDMGDPMNVNVNVVVDRPYYPEVGRGSGEVSVDEVCKKGNVFYYQDSGWQEIRLPANGGIISAAALISAAASGTMNVAQMG